MSVSDVVWKTRVYLYKKSSVYREAERKAMETPGALDYDTWRKLTNGGQWPLDEKYQGMMAIGLHDERSVVDVRVQEELSHIR